MGSWNWNYPMKKYFEALELNENASIAEIEDAYKRLSEEYDPKNNNNEDFFVEQFNKVKEAYEILYNNKSDKKDNEKKSNSERFIKCPNNHFFEDSLNKCPQCGWKINFDDNEKNQSNLNKKNTKDDLIVSQNILKSILEKYSYKSDDIVHEIILSFENKNIIINNKTTFTNIPPELENTGLGNLKSNIIIPTDDITEIFFEEKPATDFLIFKSFPNHSIKYNEKKKDIYELILSKELRKNKIDYRKILESLDVVTNGRLGLIEGLLNDKEVINKNDELDFGDSDENNVDTNDKSFQRFFKYDNEYISGSAYFLRTMLNSILIAFLIGFYLQSVTAYKRSKSLGASESSSKIWAVWGFLLWIFAFTPLFIITNTIPHFYLWFSNGKQPKD